MDNDPLHILVKNKPKLLQLLKVMPQVTEWMILSSILKQLLLLQRLLEHDQTEKRIQNLQLSKSLIQGRLGLGLSIISFVIIPIGMSTIIDINITKAVFLPVFLPKINRKSITSIQNTSRPYQVKYIMI